LNGKPASSPCFDLEWHQEVYQRDQEYNGDTIGKESKGQATTESQNVEDLRPGLGPTVNEAIEVNARDQRYANT
jgi:hypothetical protein